MYRKLMKHVRTPGTRRRMPAQMFVQRVLIITRALVSRIELARVYTYVYTHKLPGYREFRLTPERLFAPQAWAQILNAQEESTKFVWGRGNVRRKFVARWEINDSLLTWKQGSQLRNCEWLKWEFGITIDEWIAKFFDFHYGLYDAFQQ